MSQAKFSFHSARQILEHHAEHFHEPKQRYMYPPSFYCVEEAYSLGVLREGAHHDITGSELVLKPGV